MEKDEGLPFSCLSLWRWAASEWIRLVLRCSVSLYSSFFLSLSHTPPPPFIISQTSVHTHQISYEHTLLMSVREWWRWDKEMKGWKLLNIKMHTKGELVFSNI